MSRGTWLSLFFLLTGLAGGVWYAEEGDTWQPWQNAAAQVTITAPPVSTASIPQPPRQSAPAPSNLTPDELRNVHVYETANRSVVNIDTTTVQVDRYFMMQ